MALESDTPIVLIGMPGSGKSTVGRRLAAALARRFVDSDHEIERHCGVPIAMIFEYEGEEGFRRRETAVLTDLIRSPAIVLATGGGVVLSPSNRDLIGALGYAVYLQVSIAELWRRVRKISTRPLLQTADPRARLTQLLDERAPLYAALADLTIVNSRQSAAQMAADIIERLPGPLQRPPGGAPPR